jgi:hypothetical protein
MKSFRTCLQRYLMPVLLPILFGCATAPLPAQQSPLPSPERPRALNVKTTPAVVTDERNGNIETPEPPVRTDVCQQERPLDTFAACSDFLHACPSSPRRQDVLQQMCQLIEKRHGGYDDYKRFVLQFDDGLPYVPYRLRLSLIGPEGLRVHDCLQSLKSGEEPGSVLEKVRARQGIYRDFSLEEIDTLKQMGLTSDLVQAMIESTLDAQRAQGRNPQNIYGSPTPAAYQAPAVQSDGMYAAGTQLPATASGQYAPDVNETLTNCASQVAALEGCKRLSGLLKSICDATAKTQFPCQ